MVAADANSPCPRFQSLRACRTIGAIHGDVTCGLARVSARAKFCSSICRPAIWMLRLFGGTEAAATRCCRIIVFGGECNEESVSQDRPTVYQPFSANRKRRCDLHSYQRQAIWELKENGIATRCGLKCRKAIRFRLHKQAFVLTTMRPQLADNLPTAEPEPDSAFSIQPWPQFAVPVPWSL